MTAVAWKDTGTHEDDYEEIDFEHVEPMRLLAKLWWWEGDARTPECWSLSISVMDDDEQITTLPQMHWEGSSTQEAEAKAWAEGEIQKARSRR